MGDQRVITDHPPDHPLRSPSLGTKKVIRKGVTPFAPYIILYRGAGRGVGFCLSTRGPSIVQGPTFQTGPATVRSTATGGTAAHVALLEGLLHGFSSNPSRRATPTVITYAVSNGYSTVSQVALLEGLLQGFSNSPSRRATPEVQVRGTPSHEKRNGKKCQFYFVAGCVLQCAVLFSRGHRRRGPVQEKSTANSPRLNTC